MFINEGETPFIRTVVAAPQPLCVLATDIQLKQLQLCCTDPSAFSIVSVDPTFNLGSFFVTPIVFLHKAFMTKRSHKSPVFLGPILIHQQMNTHAYCFFAHQLQVLLPSLSNIQAFGTDGELALVAGFRNAFPNAIHLRCFKHCRDNCEAKLKELNLNDSARQEIIADIFGTECSTQIQLGLVDAVSEQDYDTKFGALKQRWNELEMRGKRVPTGEEVIPEFYSWFEAHKSHVVRSSMIQSVRKAAQLGDPPEKFYTNASESTNNVLKIKVDRKQQSLPDFVNHAKDLVGTYEKNIERAFYQRGDWRLADTISSLLPQKNRLAQVLNATTSLSDLLSAASLAPSTSGTDAQSNAASLLKPVDVVPGQSTTGNLSIAPQVLIEASGINIHEDTLRSIWSKAEMLVKGASLVVPVPGSKSRYDRMVASSANDCPHHVTTPIKFTGQFRCDSKCAMYGTYKICAHTVAAAEHCKQLELFLHWLIKQNVTPNLSHMALSGIPKGAGKKGGKPSSSKRKRQTQPSSSKRVVDRAEAGTSSLNSDCVVDRAEAGTSSLNSDCVVDHAEAGTSSLSSDRVVDRVEAGTSICASSITTCNLQMPPAPQYWPMYQPSFFPTRTTPTSAGATCGYSFHSQVISPFPFSLKILTSRIQICQSCRIRFHPENDHPPYNLVICRKECRQYRGNDGHMRTPSSPSNSHYHVNWSCICAADSMFTADKLLVPTEVHNLLLPEHKQFLFTMLGLQIN